MGVSSVVEIEVDHENNGNMYFLPLKRTVRGRFTVARAIKREGKAGNILQRFPEGVIPGKRIGFDMSRGVGYITEPLREPQHAELFEEISSRNKVDPEREETPNAHAPSWLHWMRRAVQSGQAKVVKGELPETIDGEPVVSYMGHKPASLERTTAAKTEDRLSRLETAIESIAAAVTLLASSSNSGNNKSK